MSHVAQSPPKTIGDPASDTIPSSTLAAAADSLVDSWSEERALFPYSGSRGVDGTIVYDYDHPLAVRYTINSLLGLQRYCESHPCAGMSVKLATDSFLRLNSTAVGSLADWGLLAKLCAEVDDDEGLRRSYTQIVTRSRSLARGTMQDVAWAVWGSCAATARGLPGARKLALDLTDSCLGEFVHPQGEMPLHAQGRKRRRIVSFGALTYYLRAMHEAAETLGHEDAARAFESTLSHTLELQGPRGEWPWMIDTRRSRAIDPYPVFAVHQDSMAMLFLLPALDQGRTEARAAIRRSLDWARGDNPLHTPMYVQGPPFWAYRSIERRERAPRARRYARAQLNALLGRAATYPGASRLRVNPECRSYHLGWLLYAWAGRT